MGGIHAAISSNWATPAIPADLSKAANSPTEMAKGIKVTMAAIYLITLEERPPARAMIIAPTAGKKIISVK
jgi:hypothetical protein